jgi:hypothetical protein
MRAARIARNPADDMDTGWHDYFGMLGGAAATLLGLLFVSVSLNAEIIFGSPHKLAMHLAQQAYHNYIIVFVVSLVAFFPEISNRSLGLVILIASAFYTVWLLIRFARAMAARLALENRVRAVRRYGLTLAGFVALLIGSRQMQLDGGRNMLVAVGGFILILAAIAISWELLVKLAQTKYTARE